jgi:hypothetical protein
VPGTVAPPVQRVDVLGGLIHEYLHAAGQFRCPDLSRLSKALRLDIVTASVAGLGGHLDIAASICNVHVNAG